MRIPLFELLARSATYRLEAGVAAAMRRQLNEERVLLYLAGRELGLKGKIMRELLAVDETPQPVTPPLTVEASPEAPDLEIPGFLKRERPE